MVFAHRNTLAHRIGTTIFRKFLELEDQRRVNPHPVERLPSLDRRKRRLFRPCLLEHAGNRGTNFVARITLFPALFRVVWLLDTQY